MDNKAKEVQTTQSFEFRIYRKNMVFLFSTEGNKTCSRLLMFLKGRRRNFLFMPRDK